MSGALRRYTKEIQKAFEMLAHSPLAASLAVGDVGLEQNRAFERRTSLSDLGIDFETTTEPSANGFHYLSKGAVTTRADTSAEAPVVPDAPVEGVVRASFKREGAVLLRVEQAHEHRIFDLDAVESAIRRRAATSSWERDWILVTHVIESSQALVLVSQDGEAEAEFSVGASANVAGVDLADANVGLTLLWRSGMAFEMLAGTEKTPLFHASRLVGGPFGDSKLKRIKKLLTPGQDASADAELRFETVRFD